MNGRYMFGGRAFVAVKNGTIGYRVHTSRLLLKAGLDELQIGAEESKEDFARRTLRELITSGLAVQILGATLIPEEQSPDAWSPESAAETAAFINGLTEPEDYAQIDSLMIELMIDFFAKGLTSIVTSQKPGGAMEDQPLNGTRSLEVAPSLVNGPA